MKFSVWPSPNHPPAETIATARWADEVGLYGVWYADHYMPNTGSKEIEPGDVHECWAVLPALAASTDRVRIGSLVSPTSVHHPALLANRAVTIDHISNGRMVLGVGAGWQINEHHAYGIELQAPKERVDRFEEAIFVMRSMLSEDRTNFAGSYYTITDAPSDPKPVQSPLPILVGTSSPRMLRITARFADEWNTWGNPTLATENHQKLTYACGSLGFDPSRMAKSVQALVVLTDSSDAAAEALDGPMGSRTIAGSAGELQERLGEYAATGFDEFIVPEFNLDGPIDARLEQLQRLHDEVLTAL